MEMRTTTAALGEMRPFSQGCCQRCTAQCFEPIATYGGCSLRVAMDCGQVGSNTSPPSMALRP